MTGWAMPALCAALSGAIKSVVIHLVDEAGFDLTRFTRVLDSWFQVVQVYFAM